MTITQEEISLSTPTGEMRSEVYRPDRAGSFPTIFFYSEIFQITSPIARTAAFIAGHGYIVIVPEVFHELNNTGTVLAYDDEGKEKGNEDKFTKSLTCHDTDTESMIGWVDAQPFCNGSIGSFGVCLGGHLAFRAALNKRVQAASCLYATDIHSSTMPPGNAPQTIERLSEIQGEIMCVWGRQDPHVPLHGRMTLYQAFNDADLHYSWHELNGEHAFMRDEGHRYDPELAMLCHRLTLDLFSRALS